MLFGRQEPRSFEKLLLGAKALSFKKLKLLSSQTMLICIVAVKNIEASFIFLARLLVSLQSGLFILLFIV